MFFRTRTRILAITALITGPMTSICIALLVRVTTWQARWYIVAALGMLIGLTTLIYILLFALNSRLIRRFATTELALDQEDLARLAAKKLLNGELPTLPPYEENLVRWEAIKLARKYFNQLGSKPNGKLI
jgi:hypothetical protein